MLHPRDETGELNEILRMEIESDKILTIVSKMKQNEITRVNETRELLESSMEEQKHKLISSIQMISFLKENLKLYTTNLKR